LASPHEVPRNPREHAEQVLASSKAVLRQAVEIVFPDNPEADPLTVFPAPKPVRAEDRGLPLDEQQQTSLLEAAGELGFGRAENVTASEQDLQGAFMVIEGGQPHKIMAETLTVASDVETDPAAWIFAASKQRRLTSPAEIDSANRLFAGHNEGITEYEIVQKVARTIPDIKVLREPLEAFEASYDIYHGFAIRPEKAGQFKLFGTIATSPVIMMRIDRHDYDDGSFDRQPDTFDILRIVDEVWSLQDLARIPIAFVTSGVYRPSREVMVARFGLLANRRAGLVTYGNDMVNAVRDTDLPPPLNQLPGELYRQAEETVKLEAELRNAHQS